MIKKIIQASGTFITKVILQLGIFSYFAHVLDIENFGVLSFAFTMFWLVSNVSDYGFRTKIVKDICDGGNVNNIIHMSDTIKTLISFLFLCLMFIYFNIYSSSSEHANFILIYIMSGYFISLSNGRFAILQARGEFNIELIFNVFAIIIYCTLVFIGITIGIDFFYYSIFFIIYSLLLLSFSSIYLKVKFVNLTKDIKSLKEEYFSATPFALLVIANIIFATVDTLLLKIFFDYDSVAIYQVFVRINTGFMLVFNIIYTVLLPKFTQYVKNGEVSKIITINRVLIIFSIFVTVIYGFFDNVIIDLLFGSEYNKIDNLTFVVIFICVIKYSMWFTNELILVCTDNQKERVKSYIAGMIITIILFTIVVPLYNWQGAAICSAIGVFIIGSIYVFSAAKYIKIYTRIDIIILSTFLLLSFYLFGISI